MSFMGKLTKKADIYSYGIVVIEIITRRKCMGAILLTSLQLLLKWVSLCFDEDKFSLIIISRRSFITLVWHEIFK
jgi:hypothetical protein